MFSRGKVRASNCKFQFGEEEIKIVNEYKYLSILFSNNGRFRKGQLEQTTRTTYALIGTSSKYDFPVDKQIQMYNSMMVPAMTYAWEI